MPGGRGAADDLVVDVGDVHHPGDREAAVAEVADEEVGVAGSSGSCRCGRARRPSGRSCRSGRGRARAARAAASRPTACRGAGWSSGSAPRRRPRAPRCSRPGTLLPLEVAGRRLDVDRGRRRARASAAIASRISSRYGGKARAGADDRQVDRRRARDPACARRSTTVANSSRAGDAARRRGPGREQPTEVAEPGGPEQGVGDRVEGDVAVRVAVQPRRPRDLDRRRAPAASPGPNGWLSSPVPTRSTRPRARGRRSPRQRGLRPVEIGGHGHLEIGRFAGECMNGDFTGLQQGGLVGPGLRPARAGTGRTRPGAGADRTPCGVWADASDVAIDRLDDATISPSMRLSVSVTGNDRDRGAVRRGRRERRPSTSAADGSGRAPSWTSTITPVVSRRLQLRRARPRPAATDSCRRVAARDHGDDPLDEPRRARISARPGPAEVTTTIRSTTVSTAASASIDHASSGRPADLVGELVDAAHPSRRARRRRRSRRRPGSMPAIGAAAASIEPRLGEDHPAGDGLEDPRHRHVEVLVDVPDPALDDDHRPVVEEADALAGLLALLDDPDPQLLAGQDGGLDGIRERVDVEDADPLELGDAVEVEVVRQDRLAPRLGQRRRASRRPRRRPGRRRRRSRPASSIPSASGRGSRARGGRDCGGACRSCRRCAGAPRGRTSGRRACRR